MSRAVRCRAEGTSSDLAPTSSNLTHLFPPGAGSPPPELAGRDGVLEQAHVLLGRVRAKRPEKSLLLTGLRGVGKNVLLNEMDRMAEAAGHRTILVEAHDTLKVRINTLGPVRSSLIKKAWSTAPRTGTWHSRCRFSMSSCGVQFQISSPDYAPTSAGAHPQPLSPIKPAGAATVRLLAPHHIERISPSICYLYGTNP